ncbi:MAG TPA: sulfite exporter TauE/SafE family protein [Chloroflexota bacterium]
MIHLDAARLVLVACAALLAGAVNAVGGGGTLLSFPALLLLGFPALTANVTSTIGLLPGYAGGSIAYRAELAVQRRRVLFLGPISVVGAVGGAILLTRTSNSVFAAVVPWLILAACALLLVQPLVTSRVRARRPEREQHRAPVLAVAQLLGGTYGAFFGAGLGVMMLAVLGLFIRDDLQRINALKGMLALVINVVAALYFAFFGPVSWTAAALMLPASAAGGFAGVSLARRLRPAVLRTLVVMFGVAFALHQLL